MQYEIRISRRVRNKILGGKQVFSVKEVKFKEIPAGSLVKLVYGKVFVAWATINPRNPRRYIRILSLSENYDPLDDLVRKLKTAKRYREKIGYGSHYRWIYSESDNLSGLVVDKFNDLVVIQNSNPFFDRNIDLVKQAILEVESSIKTIYEKSVGKSREDELLDPREGLLFGEDPRSVIVEEGKKFLIDPTRGQKTGWFLDQRENRRIVKRFAECEKLLDAFCYTGSFGIICSEKTSEVTFIDKSKSAIEILKKNLELNQVQNSKIVRANVFEVLKTMYLRRQRFDFIVLDPPDLLAEGIKKGLKSIALANQLAIKIIDDGYLATFSCSQDLKEQKFFAMLKSIIRREGKKFELIARLHQAYDHKVKFPHKELEYLKGFLLYIYK